MVRPRLHHAKHAVISTTTARKRLTAAAAVKNESTGQKEGGGGGGGGLREKYCTPGYPERPLNVLFVGHNPSSAAWKMGHYYANPSNRFWALLSGVGILPPGFKAQQDDECPRLYRIGFTDLGTGFEGTDSSKFKATILHGWRAGLYERIKAHAQRAGRPPKVVAFTGKRQFQELFFDHSSKPAINYGVQEVRPKGWPFKADETVVFVLTSSSGAAAMTNEAREAPYRELAALLKQIPLDLDDDEAPLEEETINAKREK